MILQINFLQAQGGQGSSLSFWIMMIAIFAIMYFFMIRPQNKKQKEIAKFRNSLAVGDEVITSGGIHGTIKNVDIDNNIITLEIATGVKIKVETASILPQGTMNTKR